LGRVGHLAREFGLTAATVSDAVSALEDKKLLARITSRQDRRVVNLKLTPAGKKLSNKLCNWADSIRDAVTALPQGEQTTALQIMLKLIESLQQAEIVTVARMCTTCKHFGENVHANSHSPHHCKLLDKPLAVTELRVDCAEHENRH
ncbi:MAG: MarR family winged helix-turn-helix transcriptional regulator, partial [Candidatus Zixiibacteriota bacterium]